MDIGSMMVGAAIAEVINVTRSMFIPQPREFFLGLPSWFRKRTLASLEKEKASLIRMHGDPYELILYISSVLSRKYANIVEPVFGG
jgi:hypothetical protein